MTGPMKMSLDAVVKDVTVGGSIDAMGVAKVREIILKQRNVSREEADFLFDINDIVTGEDNDSGWRPLFIETITKHVLEDDVSPGELDDEEAAYVISKIQGDGKVDDLELDLMINIVSKAEKTPENFQKFLLDSAMVAILEDGVIDADEVAMLKKIIFKGGPHTVGIDRIEADFLFELNDAVSENDNDKSWQEFFVETIARHVLDDDESPNEIDADEAKWLISRIEGDGKVDALERALLTTIKKQANSIHGSLEKRLSEWRI